MCTVQAHQVSRLSEYRQILGIQMKRKSFLKWKVFELKSRAWIFLEEKILIPYLSFKIYSYRVLYVYVSSLIFLTQKVKNNNFSETIEPRKILLVNITVLKY